MISSQRNLTVTHLSFNFLTVFSIFFFYFNQCVLRRLIYSHIFLKLNEYKVNGPVFGFSLATLSFFLSLLMWQICRGLTIIIIYNSIVIVILFNKKKARILSFLNTLYVVDIFIINFLSDSFAGRPMITLSSTYYWKPFVIFKLLCAR